MPDDSGDFVIHLKPGWPGRNLRQQDITHNDRLFAQYDGKTVRAVTRQMEGGNVGTQLVDATADSLHLNVLQHAMVSETVDGEK